MALFAAALLAAAAVYGLAAMTMYRPDPVMTGGATSYAVSVQLRDGLAPDRSIVETLWLSCRGNVSGREATIEATGGGRFLVTLEPAVGPNDHRRFVGCLEDLRLDRIIVDVVEGSGVFGSVEARADPRALRDRRPS